jgi:hypothetical protein
VDRLTQLIRFGFSTEQLPHPENRVTLSYETDALGIPRPKIRAVRRFHLPAASDDPMPRAAD